MFNVLCCCRWNATELRSCSVALSFCCTVEVLDTTQWGLTFEAPIGSDIGQIYHAFEFSAFFYMAGENNTRVTLQDGTVNVLQAGQSGMVRVKQVDKLTSDKPIQVDLITGDIDSAYESRWYSMRPYEAYSNSYVTPVGDSYGKTKVFVYNPGPAVLTITVQLNNKVYTKLINAKQAAPTDVIPTGSGAWINGTSKFVALSLTDSEDYDSDGHGTSGQYYDWGFPLVPRNELTSQVLIGLGCVR